MKYLNVTITIAVLLLLSSCANNSPKEDESELELIIMNDELQFAAIDSLTLRDIRIDYTKEQEKTARNVVTYKIVNHSDKNIFLAVMPDALWPTYTSIHGAKEEELISHPSVSFSLKDKKGNERLTQGAHARGIPNLVLEKNRDCQYVIDSIDESKFKSNYPKMDYLFYKKFYLNSFTLHPGESKTFKAVLYLPILQQLNNDNPFDNVMMYKYLDRKQQYDFSLFFYQDSSKVKPYLEDYQLQDLKNNRATIFHGELISNKIKLKVSER